MESKQRCAECGMSRADVRQSVEMLNSQPAAAPIADPICCEAAHV